MDVPSRARYVTDVRTHSDHHNASGLTLYCKLLYSTYASPFDVSYVAQLEADAVPELMRRAPALLSGKRCEAFWEAIDGRVSRDAGDWRTWNLGRRAAIRVVQQTRSRTC